MSQRRTRGRALQDAGDAVTHSVDQLIFKDLVMKIDCPADKARSVKAVLVSKLEENGAVYAQRMRKDVTHIIFVKNTDDDDSDRKRLEKVRGTVKDKNVCIVSPLWVEDSLGKNARLDEKEYSVMEDSGKNNKRGRSFKVPPPLSLEALGKAGDLVKRRKKSATPKGVVPKPLAHYEVDHQKLDSARKIKECGFDSPIGAATQAAASVLANDLGCVLDIPDNACQVDADDLDTPLSERCSRRFSSKSLNEQLENTTNETVKEENLKVKGKKGVKAEKPSQRFSLRTLYMRPERPVLLNKNLPEGPVEAKPVLKKTIGSGVPIPEVERVSSPWGTPHQSQSQTHDFDFRTASKAKKSDATPFTKKRVPSPWSTLRPWDIMKRNRKSLSNLGSQPQSSPLSQVDESPKVISGIQTTVEAEASKVTPPAQPPRDNDDEELHVDKNVKASPHVNRLSQEILTIPSPSQVTESHKEVSQDQGPLSGFLAVTSVKSSVLELCKTAVGKLDGLALWANNARKQDPITHVIIGDNRRTLKAMLGVLHGAYFLRPEYVTASLEAGHWLPEEDYLADVIFQEGSTRARISRGVGESSSTKPSLLQGKKVGIFTQGKRAGDESYQVVRKICLELGATLFHVSEADICILMNDEASSRPSNIPNHATAVKKEWLFQCCCAYQPLDLSEHCVPRVLSQ